MKTIKLLVILTVTGALHCACTAWAATRTWSGATSTAWGTAGNWVENAVPGAADDVTIPTGAARQPTLANSAVSVTSLVIQNGMTLTQGGTSSTLTTSGNCTIDSGGTLSMAARPLTVSGTFTLNGTLTSSGTCTLVNVAVGSTGSASAATLNVSGTWSNGGTGNLSTSTVVFNGTTAQTIPASYFYNLTIGNGSGGSCTLSGDIIVANVLARSGSGSLSASSYKITVAGNVTLPGANFSADTGTVAFNGTGTQTAALTTYNNLEVNGTGNTVQPQNNITINGNLTVTSGTFSQTANNRTIAKGGSGTITVGASGKLILLQAGTTPYSTAFTGGWSAPTLQTGSTVEYQGGSATSLELTSFCHLNINSSGITFSLSGTTTVSGNLTVTLGTLTTTTSNFGLSVAGDVSLTKTLTANGSTISIGGSLIDSGGTFTPGTSTVVFNGSGAQSIAGGPGNFSNLTINKSSGTATLASAITVTGDLTLSQGTLDASASSYGINLAGNWVNNGGTFTPQAGTVTFNGSVAQSIGGTASSQTFYNVTLSKTAGTTLSVGGSTTTLTVNNLTETTGNFTAPATLHINGILTLNAGTFTAGANITIAGNWAQVTAATFTPGSGTVTFDGTAAQTLGTASSLTFNNLTVNKSLGLTMSTTAMLTVNDLTVTAGSFTPPATLNINGNLLQSGGTLTAGANINVAGNWTRNSGTFTQGPNTVTFNGTSQTIAGSSATTFNNLTVNASAGLALSTGPTVNGTLTLTSGAVTSAGSLTMGSGATISRATGTLDATPGGTSFNVTYTGGTAVTAGPEIPMSTLVLQALTINNTAGVTLGANVSVNNGLSIGSGATLDVSASNYAIDMKGGSWASSGTFTPRAGTVAFSSSASQTIGTAGSLTFNNVTINKSSGTLTMATTSTLTVNDLTLTLGSFTPPATLNVNGNFLQSGGTLTAGASINVAGNWIRNGGGFSQGSYTVTLNGTGAQSIGGSVSTTFNNLTVNKASGKGTAGADFTVATVFSISAGEFDAADKTITLSGAGTPFTVTGTFTPSTSTVSYTSTAGANVTGGVSYHNLTVDGTSDTFTALADMTVQNVLTVASGDILTLNGKTITLSGAGTPLVLNGTLSGTGLSSSTIAYTSTSGATVTAATYTNLTVNGTGTFALGGAATVNGTLALTSGDLSIGANILTLNGAISATAGTLTGGATSSITFGGAGASTILPAITLQNLTVNRSAGIALGGAVSVGGTLTLTSGQMTSAGNLTIGSGASISRASGSLDAGSPTFSGTVSVAYTTGGVTTGSEMPTSTGNVLQALSFNNSSGTVTLGANVTVNGTLTIASGGTLADGGYTLTAKSTASNSGTHSSTGSGKILFAGSSAQTIAGTYGNVEMSNAAGTATSAPTTINGNLAVTTGQFSAAGFQLAVNGTTTVDSTLAVTSTTSTKTFGNVIINSSGAWNNSINETISIKGNFRCDGTFTSGTAAYTFDGTSGQDIGGSASPSFALLTLNNTAAPVTASGNFNVSGTFSINAAGVVFSPAASVVINSATTQGTLSGSGTIKVTRTAGAADFVNQYRFTARTLTSLTVDFAGAGSQGIDALSTYTTLKTSGSGTKTPDGDITVSGVLTVGTGTTLNGGSALITLSGTGTTFVVNTGGAFSASSSTVEYKNNSGANVTGGITYNNLKVTGNAQGDSFPLQGNISLTGDLNANIGTLTMGTYSADHTGGGGTLTLGSLGALNIGGTGTLPANYATHSIASASLVTYSGTAQTIAPLNSSQSYGNLTTSGTGTKTLYGSIDVVTAVTIGSTAPILVASGGVFRNSISGTFTPTGTLTFDSGATYQHHRSGGTIPTASWNANSTCEVIITGSPTTLAAGSQSFGNFIWNSPSQTTAVQLSGSLTTVNGTFTVTSTGSGSVRLTTTTSPTLAIAGDLVITGGTLDMASGSTSTTINLTGNLSISGSGVLTESGSGTANAVVFAAGTHNFSNSGTISQTVNFAVNSGSTLQMGNNIIPSAALGTFTLNSGATLGVGHADGIASSGATGNIQSTGTRTFNSGANYIYNGTAAQITGTGLTAANNLTIDNGAGVTLTASTTVNGMLALTSGVLVTGANQVSVANTANNSITVGSGWVNGTLEKSFGTTGNPQSFTFPVGDSASYEPLALSSLSPTVAGSIKASTTPGSHPQLASSGINSIGKVNQYWTLTEVSGTYGTYDAAFTYLAGEAGGTPSAYLVKKWNGSTWSAATVSGAPTTTTTAVTGVSGSGDYAIGNVAPVANADSFSRGKNLSLKILKTALTGNDTGTSISFTSVTSPSAEGATVAASGLYVFYTPANDNTPDTFTYTITDTYGATANGTVTVNVVSQGGYAHTPVVSGGKAYISFAGIPGYTYDVQRNTGDVENEADWSTVLTTNTPADGLFMYVDDPAPSPSAFYRLMGQ
jgi:hypothetical protein